MKAEKDYIFVEAAQFADMIKYNGGMYQSNWHFINLPIFEDGQGLADFPKFKPPKENITSAVQGIYDWLTGTPGYEQSFAYIKASNASKSSESDI